MSEEFIFEDQRSMRLTHYVMAERLMQVEAYKIMKNTGPITSMWYWVSC